MEIWLPCLWDAFVKDRNPSLNTQTDSICEKLFFDLNILTHVLFLLTIYTFLSTIFLTW